MLRCHFIKSQVCITAGDYDAATTAMNMMTQIGLQPEPEQEKRMQKAYTDPLWGPESSRAAEEGTEGQEGDNGEQDGEADSLRGKNEDGEEGGEADFWRERDGE